MFKGTSKPKNALFLSCFQWIFDDLRAQKLQKAS